MKNHTRFSSFSLLCCSSLLLAACSGAPAPGEVDVGTVSQDAITPIPFSWCWKYASQDGFEPSTAGDWWTWGDTVSGVAQIKTASPGSVRSGTGGFFVSYPTSEPNGSYLIADRYINRNLLVKTKTMKPGCTVPQPTASTTLRYCSASVWVRPSALNGAVGSFQLLSWPDYYYIAVKDFNLPPNSGWQQVTIENTYACQNQNEMVIRVGLSRQPTSIAAVIDDVEIVWAY